MFRKEYKKPWNLRRYCSDGIEHIENYANALADGFKGWCIHHRLGMYFDRPSFELIFMRVVDHRRLHNNDAKKRGTFFKGTTGHLGHKHTEESKQKMREAKKRRNGGHCAQELR